MPPKIFLTGATGFVGGDVLYTVSHAHPDWEWTCLVRSEEKGAKVAAAYPGVRLVYGDQDDVELIEDEASKADIVIHAVASDEHIPSAEAIVRGLRRKGSGYYIHTSGALSLAMESVVTGWYGEAFGKVYDDWDKVGEVTSLPDHAPHRKVDKVVLGAGSDAIKTAIVAPAAIYGVGRGPDKTRSFLLYGPLLKRQKVFIVGNGENVWHCVHVQDLSAIYLLLAESAVRGDSIPGEWNEEGYYLAENGSYVAREMLELTAQIAHRRGFIPSSEVDVLTPDEAEKVFPWASFVLGADSRGHGVRAKKLLGWKPKMPSFDDEIENALEIAHRGMV